MSVLICSVSGDGVLLLLLLLLWLLQDLLLPLLWGILGNFESAVYAALSSFSSSTSFRPASSLPWPHPHPHSLVSHAIIIGAYFLLDLLLAFARSRLIAGCGGGGIPGGNMSSRPLGWDTC